jgi:uncharacterized protein with HEPN domain
MIKDDLIYIDHILDSIKKIEKYTDTLTIHEFVENELVQDGVIRNFEIIGEATKHLSNSFRDKYSDIPWKQIAGMRDILIHDYLGIDIYAVWETIETNLPQLKRQLLSIKK